MSSDLVGGLPAERGDDYAKALGVLRRVWGYEAFRTGQEEVIRATLDGSDVLAVLPTGGGKSLCYQVPALVNSGLTIVISPLIALMEDQVAGLAARGVAAAFINSSLSRRIAEQRWLDAEHGRYKLLYLAPERLATEEFRLRAPRLGITRVAVDEAHCISEWGHHFRPEYRNIAEALEIIESPPLMAVTATATPEVRRDIIGQLRLRDPKVIVRGFDRPNIVWSVFRTSQKRERVKQILTSVSGTSILYAPTRRAVEEWSAWLNGQGVVSAYYHGGMSPDDRKSVQESWLRGDVRMIAATNAFGMGIDKPDVRLVLHDGVPATLESYYQEAGRAGRDGKRSYAVLLFQRSDRRIQQSLIEASHPKRDAVRAVYDATMSLAQVAVGSVVDDPLFVKLEDVHRVTGLPLSIIRSSIEILERQGVWSRASMAGSTGFIRFTVDAAALRDYAARQKKAFRQFIESILRAVDASAFSAWYAIDRDILARRTKLAVSRVENGLRFLEERGLLQWRSTDTALVIRLNEARYARLPVDERSLKRSRRRAESKLSHMIAYAEGSGCRRRHLLTYFGEDAPPSCGTCDMCLGRHETRSITRTDEHDLAAVARALEAGTVPDEIPGRSPEEVERLMDWLEQQQLIREDPANPAGYVLTEIGRTLL
ncbi:MAG: RecQ family ATP-dependent DNA helicase [Bacteroidota bacterium]